MCLQSDLRLSLLHSCLAAASRIVHPPTPLEITLKHQALAFHERALRLPADNSPLQQLASRSVQPRLEKRPSWQSFCSSQENQAPREKLILCLSTSPWYPSPNFTVTLSSKAAPEPMLQQTSFEVSLCLM